MHREDFEIFKNGLIYMDNGATTMKPSCVVDSIYDYYTKYTANAHRGDYRNSLIVEYLATARRRSFEDYKPSRKSFYMALSFSNQYTGDN